MMPQHDMWLQCIIKPGMFDGEYAVEAKSNTGEPFSLFAGQADVKFEGQPPTSGWIRVVPLDQKGDRYLIQLPQHVLENGSTVTVRESQLQATG